MADSAVTELPILISVSDDDLFYVVTSDGVGKRTTKSSIDSGGVVLFQATSSNNSVDINTSFPTVIPWDTVQFNHTDFTSDGVGKITFNKQGRYLVYVNISYDSSAGRQSPLIQFQINGTTIDGEALSGYARHDSSHNKVSNSFMRLIEVNAGDYLEVVSSQEANGGTVTLRANQSTIYIEGK